jgi:hypothetical protein
MREGRREGRREGGRSVLPGRDVGAVLLGELGLGNLLEQVVRHLDRYSVDRYNPR